jgi:hypothetical protein
VRNFELYLKIKNDKVQLSASFSAIKNDKVQLSTLFPTYKMTKSKFPHLFPPLKMIEIIRKYSETAWKFGLCHSLGREKCGILNFVIFYVGKSLENWT